MALPCSCVRAPSAQRTVRVGDDRDARCACADAEMGRVFARDGINTHCRQTTLARPALTEPDQMVGRSLAIRTAAAVLVPPASHARPGRKASTRL
jgi:hypothetical protein